MKYVSLDIETTGLNRQECQIIEFGAIIEDTNNILPYEDMPKFHCYFKYDRYNFEPSALKINYEKIAIIESLKVFDLFDDNHIKQVEENNGNIINFCFKIEEQLQRNLFQQTFAGWLKEFYGDKKSINLAGKNVAGFDLDFLKQKGLLTNIFKSRTIDPAILFVDWYNEKELPSLDLCLQKSGIDKTVSHNALEDAFDIIKILRTIYAQS